MNLIQRATLSAYLGSLRRLMPVREAVKYAGVQVALDRRYGDSVLVPRYYSEVLVDDPDYEEALVRGLNAYVKPGMTIVVIGGGVGVTAVIAAKLAGPQGEVICYEASKKNVASIRETARRNNVCNELKVHYGVVGPAISVYNDDHSAPTVEIADLPECDVLEMDCEGSEKQIISELTSYPKHILVETHGLFGAPTDEVETLLKQKGYETSDLGVAEPRASEYCIKHDIHVIAGQFRGA